MFPPYAFTHVRVNRDKRSFIHSHYVDHYTLFCRKHLILFKSSTVKLTISGRVNIVKMFIDFDTLNTMNMQDETYL